MKTIILLLILLGLCTINAQSILTVGAGASLEVENGADICADSIGGSGTIQGGGTFCGNPTGIESEEEESSLPTEYALMQNFPNPFNPSTEIEVWLPENVTNVKLSIYNTLGEKVADLVNTSLAAGVYSYRWDARDLATGIYIYELRTDKFVSVKKMILVK